MLSPDRGAMELPAVLSSLTERRVRIGEIIAALDLGRSTYYEQRDEGRLVSADNMLRLAAAMDLNPVELLLRCGLIDESAVVDCASRIGASNTSATPATNTRTRRFRRRSDAPPL